MKIALVILHADPSRGGAERYTIDLAAALHARGHEVTLAASSFAPAPPAIGRVALSAGGMTRVGRYAGFLAALQHHLASAAYDIVHAMLPVERCDLYHPHAGVAAEAIASGHLKHDSPLKRSVTRAFNRFNRRRNRFARVEHDLLTGGNPPIVLCLSRYVKSTLRTHYPHLPEDRLMTLFNAVDLRALDPGMDGGAGLKVRERMGMREAIIALMVAQDFERKGLRQAIIALSRIADPRLKLLVVGRPDPGPYRQLARSLGVEDRIRFGGEQSGMVDFYAAADFFILPTRHDPCSLVVLEALAMGLPVISTRQNGATEIMSDGEHGRILDGAQDVEGLAEGMMELCDPIRRERMGRACLDLRPRLAYETHMASLEGAYERAMALRRQVR